MQNGPFQNSVTVCKTNVCGVEASTVNKGIHYCQSRRYVPEPFSFDLLLSRDQVEENRVNAQKLNKKDAKKHRELEKKEQMERRKKENELKKNFRVRA